MSRVRFQLSETLAARGASCTQLWWPVPPSATEMKHLVSQLLSAVGLNTISLDAIKVNLCGYSVLLNSSTALLRDGDLLELEINSQQNKKRKQPEKGTVAAVTPAPKKIAAAVGDKDQKTPAHNGVVPLPVSENRPSRSARRKAAKRLRKRQGLDVLPLKGHRHPQKQQAAALNGRFKATAVAAVQQDKQQGQQKRKTFSSSEEEEEEEESSEDEGTSPSSSTATTTSSSDTSSSSSSSSSSEEEEDTSNAPSSAVQMQAKMNAQFSSLPPCNGMPSVGRVVAYKLLEVGEDFAPRISEARLGKVVVADATQELVIIEPYPDPSIHPLKSIIRSRNNGDVEEEEEEEREPPPSNYDEDGVLTAELSTFSELKYFDDNGDGDGGKVDRDQEKVLLQNLEKQALEKAAIILPLGPTNYSRLGPPPPPAGMAATGTPPVPIRDPEVLASLVAQLQQRRAELAAEKLVKEVPKTDQKADEVETQEAANNLSPQKKRNPRHRGALQSAMGPMLRMLRNSKDI